jgi:hypothetical protein
MGLDVVLYDDNGARLALVEIASPLHEALFAKTSNWSSYKCLRKLRDYYRTNVTLQQDELRQLVDDLTRVRMFVDPAQHKALDALVECLSQDAIARAHIAGD